MQLRSMRKASKALAKWASNVEPTIQLHKAHAHLVEHLGGSHQTLYPPALRTLTMVQQEVQLHKGDGEVRRTRHSPTKSWEK
jgi:hypothetical protein